MNNPWVFNFQSYQWGKGFFEEYNGGLRVIRLIKLGLGKGHFELGNMIVNFFA